MIIVKCKSQLVIYLQVCGLKGPANTFIVNFQQFKFVVYRLIELELIRFVILYKRHKAVNLVCTQAKVSKMDRVI